MVEILNDEDLYNDLYEYCLMNIRDIKDEDGLDIIISDYFGNSKLDFVEYSWDYVYDRLSDDLDLD